MSKKCYECNRVFRHDADYYIHQHCQKCDAAIEYPRVLCEKCEKENDSE